jgi:hypothetical protein
VRVRDRVAIAVEAHVRRLAGRDGAHHVGREGMRGERQEARLLFRQDVGHGRVGLFGMRTLIRNLVPPAPKLRVQIIDIREAPRHKGGVPEVLNLASIFPFSFRRPGVQRRGAK